MRRTQAASRHYLTAKEVEERYPFSRWTVRAWAYEGKITSVKVGSKLLIPIAEIERLIAEGTRQRVAPAESSR